METINLVRILHLVHSVDILMSYRATSPTRASRTVAFILKLPLFMVVNSIRHFAAAPFPSVPFDAQTIYDFILLFLTFEVLWQSKFLELVMFVLKGDASLLTFGQRIVRAIHTALFTTFRLLAGFKLIQTFSDSYWQCVFVIVSFLEFNGAVLKLMKGERSLVNLFATMRESVTVAMVTSVDIGLYLVLAYTLVDRHILQLLRQFIGSKSN